MHVTGLPNTYLNWVFSFARNRIRQDFAAEAAFLFNCAMNLHSSHGLSALSFMAGRFDSVAQRPMCRLADLSEKERDRVRRYADNFGIDPTDAVWH
jgi:hypothetical protein